MACIACQGYVRVLEGKVRQVVGETRLVELVYVGVPTQMFRVAASALARGGLWHPAVVAGPGPDICRSVLVAVEAECCLAVAVGAVMAVAAFAFDPGVRLADGTGHDELLDVGRMGSRNE
jgi:hypothetical protein